MATFRNTFPRVDFRRTSASAQRTPKIVFAGTTISTMRTESQSAWRKLGAVSASHTGEKPFWNVRQKTNPTGRARSRPR